MIHRCQCPKCGSILQTDPAFAGHPIKCQKCKTDFITPIESLRGPPFSCWHCDSDLVVDKEKGVFGFIVGAILILVGMLLSLSIVGMLLGIPAIIFGIIVILSGEGIYRCSRCEAKYPRRSSWWQK